MVDNYLSLMSEIIKKQTVILGPQIAILKARSVPGLHITESGDVTSVDGDPQATIERLIDEYVSLAGLIVKKAMEPLLAKYPEIKLKGVEEGQK